MKVEPSPRKADPREEQVQESIGGPARSNIHRSERARHGRKALKSAAKTLTFVPVDRVSASVRREPRT